MTREEMINLTKRYFDAVDGENFNALSKTLTDDCVFTVETHGVRLSGREELQGMFQRLWRNHSAVLHRKFVYVVAPENQLIATQFQVVNTRHDGRKVQKSNCNFFKVREGRFCNIAVYMAGENTLDNRE